MKKIKFYLKWLLYLWASNESRLLYKLAQEKGCYCIGYKNGIAKFDVTSLPQERDFMTFAEYKENNK